MKRRLMGCVSVALVTIAVSACVLADPPATLPIVAEGPPSIEADVVPSTLNVLTQWPTSGGFVIPVYLIDPTKTIQWLAYTDYSAVPMASLPTAAVKSVGPNDGAAVRVVHAVVTEPVGPGCHTVEVIIAYSFTGFTPDPPSAIVSWFFAPSGDPDDCSPYEAGALADATFPGTASEAGVDVTVQDGAN